MEKLKQNYDIRINTVYFPLHPETPQNGRRLDELFGPHADIPAMMRNLKARMDAEGLPFDEGRHMTFNSRLAQELAKWAEGRPESEALKMALYQAYFVDGQNVGDATVLLRVIEKIGLPLDEAQEVLEQRTMRPAVDADWQHARGIGVTAVPTFAVGLTGVVGAQPYEQLAHLLDHVGAVKR
ncbi:MAG: DsbA family protein [Chloroflexota bacterium]|nr:MAG: DsbA family protein [Chloroflexota bacterium]